MVGYEISFEDDDSPSAAPLENVYGTDRIHLKKKPHYKQVWAGLLVDVLVYWCAL